VSYLPNGSVTLIDGSALLMRYLPSGSAMLMSYSPNGSVTLMSYLPNGSAMLMRGKSLTCRLFPKRSAVYDLQTVFSDKQKLTSHYHLREQMA
jgi:hypothetical protein